MRTVTIFLALAAASVAAAQPEVVSSSEEADRVRIQRHLAGVEALLRNKDVSHLSAAQRQAREAALDRLHDYWQAGVFPRNAHAPGRTPVFIDEGGRACAMGDLLQFTGAEDAAERIAREQNLARVYDIDAVDLAPWLDAHGLTVHEAQQIQPTYCFTCDDEPDDQVCGADGVVYRNACMATECAGVAVSHDCESDPCECPRTTQDAGAEPEVDAGTPMEPVSDDGCSAGGGGSGGLLALLLLVGLRRRTLGALGTS